MNRRRLIGALGIMIAAPAIVRSPGLLMPVKPWRPSGKVVIMCEDRLVGVFDFSNLTVTGDISVNPIALALQTHFYPPVPAEELVRMHKRIGVNLEGVRERSPHHTPVLRVWI